MSASFRVVLVRPLRPANVGAAARAVKNFGFSDLRVVGSREALPGGPGHAEARALAWNAEDVLHQAVACATLGEAIADAHLAAATTERPAPGRQVLSPREFAAEAARLPEGSRTACVFGPEDHGLTNAELEECRVRVRIPARGEQPSLNLAQAVVIVAYEAALALSGSAESEAPLPAAEGDLQRLSASARELLLRAGYLNPQAPQHLMAELGHVLSRARPTAREVALLEGLVAQLRWAVEHPRAREA